MGGSHLVFKEGALDSVGHFLGGIHDDAILFFEKGLFRSPQGQPFVQQQITSHSRTEESGNQDIGVDDEFH